MKKLFLKFLLLSSLLEEQRFEFQQQAKKVELELEKSLQKIANDLPLYQNQKSNQEIKSSHVLRFQ